MSSFYTFIIKHLKQKQKKHERSRNTGNNGTLGSNKETRLFRTIESRNDNFWIPKKLHY